MEFQQDAVVKQRPEAPFVHSHQVALGRAVEGAEPFRVRISGHGREFGDQLLTPLAVRDKDRSLRVVDEPIGLRGGAELGMEKGLRVRVEAVEDALAFGAAVPASAVVAALLPVVQPEERLDGLRGQQVGGVIGSDLAEVRRGAGDEATVGYVLES